MATTRKRRSIDEIIAEQEAKLKALKAAKRNAAKGKKVKVTKDSEGMQDLFAQMDKVAKLHKLTMPQLVREVARIRRTGLNIEE